MKKLPLFPLLGLVAWLTAVPITQAQTRPYIGFAYPAGGQQGKSFQVKIGGQNLDDVRSVLVTGQGVKARVLEYHRRLNNQEMTLLREQLNDLRKEKKRPAESPKAAEAAEMLKEKIASRMAEFVQRPACASIASVAIVEVTLAPNAKPGQRELRLETPVGVSNPLVFYVGQEPEITRKPMMTCEVQVLGKEELSLRKRPINEAVVDVPVPCTVNGQTASGEVDKYRFKARKGQQLVISALARQLIPYIADAVPGWFQPVLTLHDPTGKEVAYVDDFRFKPDPIIFYKVPEDGEYMFTINDSIYRGREDFVYRITVGEVPYVTSIFPLGGRVGDPVSIKLKGVNLGVAEFKPPARGVEPGVYTLAEAKNGAMLNGMPFDLDTLPEAFDQEPNNSIDKAQKVTLPVIINGRVDRPEDWDVFQFTGRAGQMIVADVRARRLDSPLDSILKITDAAGKILAVNDDRDDPEAGVNTHPADSYLKVTLPADGTYYAHIGDTSRGGGEEFGYRLRLGPQRPDFALRVVPSSVSIRNKGTATVNVLAIRKDGFAGPITVRLGNAPRGLTSSVISMTGTQQMAQLTLKADWQYLKDPICLTPSIVGSAQIDGRGVNHQATPAEDRMQAFLWRHLVPASDLKLHVYNPSNKPQPHRLPVMTAALAAQAKIITATAAASDKQQFSKKQVTGRLRELRLLFDEGLLSNEFYVLKLAECEAAR